MTFNESPSASAVVLYAVRLTWVLLEVMLVEFNTSVEIVGFAFRIVTLFDLTLVPSISPSFGVAMTVQFSPRLVSCATMMLVLFWYNAKICSAERDLFQMVISSICPLKFKSVAKPELPIFKG